MAPNLVTCCPVFLDAIGDLDYDGTPYYADWLDPNRFPGTFAQAQCRTAAPAGIRPTRASGRHHTPMGVGQFDTKVAVVVRDDLVTWQRLNVTAFLMSGLTAQAGPAAIGHAYEDADGRRYLPLLVQPVLVFEAAAAKLATVRARAERRGVEIAIYAREMFATGNDEDNRAAVRAVPTEQLDLVGLGLRAPHRDADAILRGLTRHP